MSGVGLLAPPKAKKPAFDQCCFYLFASSKVLKEHPKTAARDEDHSEGPQVLVPVPALAAMKHPRGMMCTMQDRKMQLGPGNDRRMESRKRMRHAGLRDALHTAQPSIPVSLAKSPTSPSLGAMV